METKQILNGLIAEDKKHIRLYDKKFAQYDKAKKTKIKCYFILNNESYLITNYVEVKMKKEKSGKNTMFSKLETPSKATYFIRFLNAVADFEDNDCTQWIFDNFEYIKNRVDSIHDNGNTCHIYQFKKSAIDGSKKHVTIEIE